MGRPNSDALNEKHRLHSEGLRRCSRCKDIRPEGAYGAKANDTYGLQQWCKGCINAYNRAREKTPEARDRANRRHKAWRRGRLTVADHRRANLRRKYGITPEDYARMLVEQFGRCAICGSAEAYSKTEHFHVDHDHVTGAVRALLCGRCNPALGAFQDDPAILRAAIAYLARFTNEETAA